MEDKKLKHFVGGFLPSEDDPRDYTLEKVSVMSAAPLPEEYRTEGNVPVLNQGINSDCVAHAIAVASAYGQYKINENFNDFSRGYIYGNRRATDYQGEGMYVRQALKNFNHDGDCLNVDFPYRGSYPKMKAKIAEKPEEYKEKASKSKLINYFRLYSEEEVKRALISHGAVVVGITIYSSFSTHAKVPTKEDKKSGGHAMCCVGWNKDGWIIQNSWGKFWGDGGYCYLPYDYPVDEWWGLTMSDTIPEPEIDNWFKRIITWFKNIWKKLKVIFSEKD